jgi:hypothetical protein
MALSKAEARQAIASLAKELGGDAPANLEQIDTLDLLQPSLEGLQAKKAEADGDGAQGAGDEGGEGSGAGIGAPPPPPTDVDPPAPKKKVATSYVVEIGKMVTTKRGTIGALEHVWPTDFAGGQRDLDHWVTHGFVTKTDHFE